MTRRSLIPEFNNDYKKYSERKGCNVTVEVQ